MTPQVTVLPVGRELPEDTGTIDPADRCHQAADHLTQVSAHHAHREDED